MKQLFCEKNKIEQVYKLCYDTKNSRGKSKQHAINNYLINIFKSTKEFENCDFYTEYKLSNSIFKTWGEHFVVDVAIFYGDKLVAIVLGKAPASNIKQNKINSQKNIVGELKRLNKLKNVKIFFVNLHPKVSPFFDKSGKIKHFEKNKVENTLQYLEEWEVVNAYEFTVFFDIENIESCENKEDVKKLLESKNRVKNVEVHSYDDRYIV